MYIYGIASMLVFNSWQDHPVTDECSSTLSLSQDPYPMYVHVCSIPQFGAFGAMPGAMPSPISTSMTSFPICGGAPSSVACPGGASSLGAGL